MKKYQGENFVVGRVQACDVRCDRQTPYGNPFKMEGKSDEERIRVCRAFRQHLWTAIQRRDPKVMHLLQELSDAQRKKGGPLKLGCHCAPKLCHCDSWAGAVDYCLEQELISAPTQLDLLPSITSA